jgi:hypothetical protein
MISFPLRPVSARLGRKELVETKIQRTVISGGHSPFRGHGGALKRARNTIASRSRFLDRNGFQEKEESLHIVAL